MANRDRREALRGAGEALLDLFAEILTSEQWKKLLRAPLKQHRPLQTVSLMSAPAAKRASAAPSFFWARPLLPLAAAWHEAAGRGHVYIMRAAIERGADMDTIDLDGETALQVAAFNEGGARRAGLSWHGRVEERVDYVGVGGRLASVPQYCTEEGVGRRLLISCLASTVSRDARLMCLAYARKIGFLIGSRAHSTEIFSLRFVLKCRAGNLLCL